MLKKKNQTIDNNSTQEVDVLVESEPLSPVSHTTMRTAVTVSEAVEINAIEDALAAMMDILNKYFMQDQYGNIVVIKKDESANELLHKQYFHTIAVENGQVDRLINNRSNGEGVIGLPGIFMHFIDMHWDVGTSSIGTCKATFRMKVVLNRLDIDSYDGQMNAYRVAHQIINCLNEHKDEYSAFTRKFQLDYFDLMESWTKGIQYFWLTYQIWLTDYTTYSQKNYVERHLVVPPFTNHSDQETGNNDFEHSDHMGVNFDEKVKYTVPDGTERIPIRKR